MKNVSDAFIYNSATGDLTWKINRGGGVRAGMIAGCKTWDGYRQIKFMNKAYQSHRIAWLMFYGVDAPTDIDHIDGNRSNNAIVNLRLATDSENQQNRKRVRPDNKTGFMGVHFRDGKYFARITLQGRQFHIGCFDDPQSAHQAYLAKKREVHPFCTI